MNRNREQLCPWWLSALIGGGVLLTLAITYPRHETPAKQLATQGPSLLSVAYLEAWLRVEPNSVSYLDSLAMQYLKLGHWESALATAKRLEEMSTDDIGRQKAILLELVATEQMTYALAQNDSRRTAGVARVAQILQEAAGYRWNIRAMRALAEKARSVGADKVMVGFYRELAAADFENASEWQARLGDVALSTRAYEAASFSYFSAYAAADTLDLKRTYFLKAVAALESANWIERACAEAELRVADLAHDRQTVSYLLALARKAGRPDLTARYARALFHSPRFGKPSSRSSMDPRVVLVTAAARPRATEPGSEEQGRIESEYELVYTAFIESGQLEDAENVARQALEAGYDLGNWSRRLAQAAQWNGHSETALTYWRQYAEATGDAQAWTTVMQLAPELEDDDSFLAAWRQQGGNQSNSDSGVVEGQNALLARYMQMGRWASALRVIGQLKTQPELRARQRNLMLEVTATEQRAYEFAPDDPRRKEFMDRLVAVMEETREYQWDFPAMAWLAGKGRDAGIHDITAHYYSELARLDRDNAASWSEQLGDLALSRQRYDDAAQAYFTAQDVSGSRDHKRQYFQSGLNALLSGGQVDRACEEGVRRVNDLGDDPATLRYLINLARQAHRTDLMADYARQLLKLRQQNRSAQYQEYRPASTPRARANPAGWRPGEALPLRYADYRPTPSLAALRPVAMQGQKPTQSDDEINDDFEVAFRAFVESRRLDEAERTAENALSAGLDSDIWVPRLAQVAEWNSHPDTALKYWWRHARATGQAQAWASVQRLALQLDDVGAALEALNFAANQNPSDTQLVDQLVAAFERVGRPEAGMEWLSARARGPQRQSMLERYAALAARAGHDAQARSAYQDLLQLEPGNPIYAMHLAGLDYAAGDLATAMATLRNVREGAPVSLETAAYWRLYSELARISQNQEDADFAYRRLLATGQSTDSDLNAMAYFYQAYPLDGGRIAELAFRQNGSATALQTALRLYSEAGAWRRIQSLLDSLSPEQRNHFAGSAGLLMVRARYYGATRQWEAALGDLRQAVQNPDATDETRLAYLWTLVSFGPEDELRMALHAFRDRAQSNADLWGAYAAGELRMGNAAQAARYLRRQRLQKSDDPLWLTTLANAEEASGQEGRAWQLRAQAWALLQQKSSSREPAEPGTGSEATDLREPLVAMQSLERSAARITLAVDFRNMDYSRALLIQLLEQEGRSSDTAAVARSLLWDTPGLPPVSEVLPEAANSMAGSSVISSRGDRYRLVSATAAEVALAWALSGEHNELARAWLAQQYADRLMRPADAELTLALAADDRAAIAALLETRHKALSLENRVEALRRTQSLDQAQTLAFSGAEGAPDSDARHQLLVETLMQDRPAVGGDVVYTDSSPLRVIQSSVIGSLKLTGRVALGLEAVHRSQRSTDLNELAWVPAHDREVKFTLSDVTPDRRFALTVGARDAWDRFYTVSLRAELNRQSSFRTALTLGLNQFTDVSQEMQVGAMKDTLQMAFEWDASSRWFLLGAVSANRFRAQDRTLIGDGMDFTVEAGYRLFATHPDWNIRLVGARGIFSASDNVISSLQAMLPDGSTPNASVFMPENFTQYGLMLGFGGSDAGTYWRGWRPFLDLGYVRDSNQGWGPSVNVGFGGPLVGNDHLRLFYLHAAAPQGSGRPTTQVGLSYRLFF